MTELRERLLSVMDRKDHSAWPAFTRPGLSKAQLAVHFGQEWGVYVRDFPVLLSRVLGQGPPADVRRALAENIYEEQTGGLSGGTPHPDLFLGMIDGLGIARGEITEAKLLPAARAYRDFLDRTSIAAPWVIGCAVLTIFVEGSRNERDELAGRRVHLPIEEAIRRHPMVAFYGCPPEKMGLVRAHRAVEGGHRADAWRMVEGHAGPHEDAIAEAVEQALRLWLAYRDEVCATAKIG
jgi:pyrroloquinoline-quinone synthase